jgi:hypothetical protein
VNLNDLTDEGGLQQDEWSLSAPTFGKDGQLAVVGWGGKRTKNSDKYYILKCAHCSKDSELFGEGFFQSIKSNLIKDKLPCGCSRFTKWSRYQYTVLCKRKAEELGYKFLDFVGEWKGASTKIKMLCEKHGEWTSGIVSAMVGAGNGCPECRNVAITEMSTKGDEVMVESFFNSDGFHPDTKFWRSERLRKSGHKGYWFMSCPDCGQVGESISSNLQRGCRPCACSKHRQQECYINLIIEGENPVAIKFGVARDASQRVDHQCRTSNYTVKQHSVYQFPDVASCKKAERECRQELECGVVLRRDMPDGYTETTWVYNLEKIIQIYERNGGTIA